MCLQQEMQDEAGEELQCLDFWHNKHKELPILFKLTTWVHSFPGTLAPIELMFSHGGMCLRPHRARLADEMLSKLLFLKCIDDFKIQTIGLLFLQLPI
jgi:hAT family C-terminal dimerisation region